MRSRLGRYIGLPELLVAVLVAVLAVIIVITQAQASPASSGTDYPGPFVNQQHVPAPCVLSQADTRYYFDNAPQGSAFLRSGAHGHGGYLKCIAFTVTGPSYAPGDHPYTKYLIFPGRGLLIPASGIDVSYVNCALPGYHFPYPAGNGQPNDCGESWVTGEDQAYVYQDNTAGDLGKPMFPARLP